ncbi:MAG: rhomboid family intramembrane serine protease [Chloroflexi bacterium]|nr:rhomboid family intramembrane serine protease [Chloroflexota bacterium]
MIPLRDTIRSRSFPVVNWLVIVANLLVFVLIELPLRPHQLDRLVLAFGVVPARCALIGLAGGQAAVLPKPALLIGGCAIPLFTSMFLHSGWVHIISNLWALYIFGDNVEDRMGPLRYLFFYLLGGIVAGLTQVIVDPASRVPAIGASGAIAGVLGAYLVLFPNSRVYTLVPLFFLPWFVEIPAVIYLGFWFVSQFFSGVFSLGVTVGGGVAYWAHIGGFVFGVLLVPLFARRPRVEFR